ncbi:MAG TPA: CoA ester lyase [Candidatus Thermoplasmatota archaeon]|nr:CoA ester lyase [Candidatus Thermoplasmatota archaeon]
MPVAPSHNGGRAANGRPFRLRRSQLAVPASNPRMMEKAALSEADEVFLDLEDAVAPSKKPEARKLLVTALGELDFGKRTVCYRINGLDTSWWYEDVIQVVSAAGDRIHDLMIPKVETPGQVEAVDLLLAQVEANAGLEPGRIGLEAQIEGPRGAANAREIARASPRLEALIFGPGDFAAAVGMPTPMIGDDAPYESHAWHAILSWLVWSGKAAGLAVLDGPYARIDDAAGYRRSCERARFLGVDGKWAIHPDQIPIANEVFAPTKEQTARAVHVLSVYEKALAEGKGALKLDGEMVDAATLRMANTTIATARAAGLL